MYRSNKMTSALLVPILLCAVIWDCTCLEVTTSRYNFFEEVNKIFLNTPINNNYTNSSHILDDFLIQTKKVEQYNSNNDTDIPEHTHRVSKKMITSIKIPTEKKSKLQVKDTKNKNTSFVYITDLNNKKNYTLVVSTKKPKVTTLKSTNLIKKQKPNILPIITKWKDNSDLSEIPSKKTKLKDIKISSKKKMNVTETKTKKQKPNIHPINTKWKKIPEISEIKQNWYEPAVPYPNPNPSITSASPDTSLSELFSPIDLISSSNGGETATSSNLRPEISSFSPPYSLTNVPDILPDYPIDSYQTSSSLRPLNTFKLDIVPDDDIKSPCPSVHISSAMLPEQRQDCSDINLVINSHLHQNSGDNRLPTLSTYDSVPADPVVDAEPVEAVQSDPGVGSAQAAVPPAGSVGSGGTGGSGGSGGSGGNGDGGGFKFPDLKHLFEAIGYMWNGLGNLFGFLRNPYLYIIPMLLFFLIGFFKVLAIFPWWIPLLLLYVGIKSENKNKQAVSFYKHIHKPIKHLDGWFWNHKTKTWEDIKRIISEHSRKDLSIDYDAYDSLSDDLSRIHNLYPGTNKTGLQLWRKKKNRLATKQKTETLFRSNTNSTRYDVLDTRTPPGIKILNKTKIKPHFENSHPGVAIPLDADSVISEESFKSKTPLADTGTTTWVLLSGQIFSTTIKPGQIVSQTIKPTSIDKKYGSSQSVSITIKPTSTDNKKLGNISIEQPSLKPLIDSIMKPNQNTTKNKTESITISSSNVTLEAKDAAINLESDNTKKTKKKKNKHRRRKPLEKTSSTDLTNPIRLKDGTLSNQLYNYLSREIVPTLGVGLVGLVVTAGLASYFLYPFGTISRSSEIDRMDSKVNNYYYKDKYSGGMPEEEAIGEVIAGMHGNLNNFLKSSTFKKSHSNKAYRVNNNPNYQNNIKGSVEKVPFTFDQVNERGAGHNEDRDTQNESDNFSNSIYTPSDKPLFMTNTGETKIEELNPVKISEHGPRYLRN